MKMLKFYAQWCAPCKALSLVMEKVKHNIPVGYIDIEKERDVAVYYGVRSVPLLLLIDENDNIIGRHNGTMTEDEFKKFIKVKDD